MSMIPRPEHPFPQMERENWLNLNGEWDFAFDFGKSGRDREFYKNGGYKHCKGCGKLFKMHKNEPGRLYCKDCGRSYNKSEFKTMKCIDCGTDFVVSVLNTKTCRCEECYREYRRKYKAEKEKERRARLKEAVDSAIFKGTIEN